MKLSEMDNSMKSACFEEITHLICDADKRVSITDVSNNWSLSHRDSETILLEWMEKNNSHTMNKEFLIRGVEKNGHCVITVLAEKKLDVVQKKFEKFCYSLYSVELASKSNANRLHVAKSSDSKWINLPLKHAERDIVVKPLPIQKIEEPATTSKKIQSMFSASKPTIKSEVKQEKTSPEIVENKTEKETPKKLSPKKKESAKTSKMASGKASISSFFSKPSSAAAHLKSKNAEVKKVSDQLIEEEPNNSPNTFSDESLMHVDDSAKSATDTKSTDQQKKKESTTKNNNKRSIVDVDEDDGSEEIPCTPQESKKVKKSVKKCSEKSSKHSRIMKMEDSSDDDDNRDEQLKLLASPVKEKENKTPPKTDSVKATEKSVKSKAKRMVRLTFEDEDGYLVTTNKVEEYSEEENDIPPPEPVQKVEDVSTAEASDKTTTKKKKTSPPKAGSKQGTILSFFSKK